MKHPIVLLVFSAIALWTAPVTAADLNISNPSYPFTPAGNVGWDPGMFHARIGHWAYDGRPNPPQNEGWYLYFSSCPDDGGVCPNDVRGPQYQSDFDIEGSITPCHPNTGDATQTLSPEWNGLPCPLYANWYGWWGTPTAREYATGINNYNWHTWNSPNIYAGLEENVDRTLPASDPASLKNRRLDNALLSVTLTAYLSRDYVQDGVAARGQGRINMSFKFIPANAIYDQYGNPDRVVVVEMNLSNMRVNLNDGRTVSDPYPHPAAPIPVSNPWRDDIWAEYIPPYPGANPNMPGTHTYVIGARNWGFNLDEGVTTNVFFDPWWVATTLVWPPSQCPTMLNPDGTDTGSYTDPGGYGFVPCGGNKDTYALPYAALFGEGGQPAAIFLGFYSGVEMAGSAVYGDASFAHWTIQRRW